MTPPLRVPATVTPPPPAPESPEIQAARQANDKAGYERNGAEAAYKQAVKDHTADSPEAKSAKAALDQAQAKVESTQADLKKALKLPQVAKVAPTKAPPQPPPAPEKTASNNNSNPTEKTAPAQPNSKGKTPRVNSESVKKIYEVLPPIRGEYIEFRSEVYERILKNPKSLERLNKLLEEIKKDPQINGEYLQKLQIHGEFSRSTYFNLLEKLPEKTDQPEPADQRKLDVSEARPQAPRPSRKRPRGW